MGGGQEISAGVVMGCGVLCTCVTSTCESGESQRIQFGSLDYLGMAAKMWPLIPLAVTISP